MPEADLKNETLNTPEARLYALCEEMRLLVQDLEVAQDRFVVSPP